jgi:predicted AlkP superfamily pyrophosphatase or phosphodiesterase
MIPLFSLLQDYFRGNARVHLIPSNRLGRRFSVGLLGVLLILALFGVDAKRLGAAPPAMPPRLVVLVMFDQMRADYLTRWHNLFEPGGFRRLREQGAWFPNCHYPYSGTFTGPGHASLATGCAPDRHGIVANDWFDRAAGKTVYCVGSDRYTRVASADPAADNVKRSSSSPERLLAPTLGESLKQATAGKGRIVALSFKDRSAVLLAGPRADACYWFDPDIGEFVTSSYYRDRLHSWVDEFNRDRPADRWFSQEWKPLRPDIDYGSLSTLLPGERSFPHSLGENSKRPGKSYYQNLYVSPFGNELLLELAKRAITRENLGRKEAADLLCVSFSCNDPIGHAFGPDSPEVLDVTLRSDRMIKDLLEHLDAAVGKGKYLLALTADHGVCPLPEVSRKQGRQAIRIDPKTLSSQIEEFLTATFGQASDNSRWLEAPASEWIYLNQRGIRARGKDPAKIETALAGWLKQQPGILTAFTRSQLRGAAAPGDTIGERVRRSFHPDRSGDLALVMQPYSILWPTIPGTGTTHGTPHAYDTHVPLLIYGHGIPPGSFPATIQPLAIPAVVAARLGIPPPKAAGASVPQALR